MSSPTPNIEFASRRGTELLLTAFALAISFAAFAIVGLGVDSEENPLSGRLATYGLGLTLLVAAAHLVIRFAAKYADPVVLPTITVLNGLGLAMIYRLDLAEEENRALGQLTWTALGVLLFVAVLLVIRDHRRLQRVTYTAAAAAVTLLILPMIPGIGVTSGGARIWVNVGGLSFQPGEAAKLCLLVFFAGYLVVKKDALALAGRRILGIDLPRGRDLLPLAVAWAVAMCILVLQRDLGTALLFFGLFVLLLYVSTERPGWLVVGFGSFAAGSLLAFSWFAHVQNRVNAWLHPFDPEFDDISYQVVQALYGMAYGGVLGRGLGQGHPDLIPVAESDFIIAAFGEELGLTGLMAIILLYGFLVERGLRTSVLCKDQFGKLLAAGFASIFAIQVFVVVGGVTKLIPSTGLTTPFLSMGGSSLVMNWALAALLLRISDFARRPAPEVSSPSEEAMTQVVKLR